MSAAAAIMLMRYGSFGCWSCGIADLSMCKI
jgi:hypothetical protein